MEIYIVVLLLALIWVVCDLWYIELLQHDRRMALHAAAIVLVDLDALRAFDGDDASQLMLLAVDDARTTLQELMDELNTPIIKRIWFGEQ